MNADTYNLLLHIHSVGRWILLLLLLIAIFNSLVAGQRPWIRTDARTGTILLIVADLMLLLGLVQWYFGPRGYNLIKNSGMSAVMKDSFQRFFAIEHLAGMLIAIILIHIGKAQARRPISDRAKHRRTVIFYLIALIIILAMIPWPFRTVGGQAGSGWY
jgi:L-asparagine transporter-like permease